MQNLHPFKCFVSHVQCFAPAMSQNLTPRELDCRCCGLLRQFEVVEFVAVAKMKENWKCSQSKICGFADISGVPHQPQGDHDVGLASPCTMDTGECTWEIV